MDIVPVAVAVITDSDGRVLLAKRAEGVHQGGLWEFPGGKVDPGESLAEALLRECREELGIHITDHRPLIQVTHDYGDRCVQLNVHWVKAYRGNPEGREGQPLAWVMPAQLGDYPMPAADKPIVDAIRLPDRYLITPAELDDHATYLDQLQASLAQGIRLVQFRVQASAASKRALAEATLQCCRAAGALLLINEDIALARSLGADGVHLKGAQLRALQARPEGLSWVGASCHSADDFPHLVRAGVDFAVLSPVMPTQSHPEAAVLGWPAFGTLARQSPVPVFALGGLGPSDLPTAWSAGAQGVAAITGLWRGGVAEK